jgi:hypothetical protein
MDDEMDIQHEELEENNQSSISIDDLLILLGCEGFEDE